MRWAGWVTTTRAVAWARRLPAPVRMGAGVAALAAAAAGVLAPAAPLVEPPGVVVVEPVAPADGGASVPLALPPVVPPASGPATETSSAAVVPAALEVAQDSLGIPGVVLGAYWRAAAALASGDPSCHLSWPLLAGIGKVESGHARGGDVDATGLTRYPILGPVLDGHPGTAAIRDTDRGRWDEDTVWDRAVGPMQFIPSSWLSHGVDGNGDGSADPSNVYDATLSAGWYLCAGGRDLATTAGLHAAVLSYNHSEQYVATVLAWMRGYASGAVATTAVGVATYGPISVVPAVLTAPTAAPTTAPAAPATAPTATPTPSASASPTPSPSPSASADPSTSPSGSPSPTDSPTSSPSPSESPSPSPTACPTSSPTADPSPSPTADATTSSSEVAPSPDATGTAATSTDATPTDGCPTASPAPTGTASPTPTG